MPALEPPVGVQANKSVSKGSGLRVFSWDIVRRRRAVLHWGLVRGWMHRHKAGLGVRRRAHVRDEYVTNTGIVREARDQITKLKGELASSVAASNLPNSSAAGADFSTCSLPELQFE